MGGKFVKGQSGNPNGRKAGEPNKATTQAREAIAAFVDDGSESFKTWLGMVANGMRETQKLPDGSVVETDKWLVRPDPAAAFRMVTDVLEYHLPKLARHEHTGKDGGDINLRVTTQDDEAIISRYLNNQQKAITHD